MSTDQLYFTFTDGSVLGAHPELPKLSTLIAEKQQKSEPISVSDLYIGEKFNLFAEKFFPKYADQLDKLEQTADKEDWWMELISDNKELGDVARGLYQDDLIRVGNAAADLGFPGLVHACGHIMAELTENMKLDELREFLNEDYDFPDDVKAKIEGCLEFDEL